MDIKLKLNSYIDVINKQLDKYFVNAEIPEKTIYEAVRYSLMAGGKRIRPVLVLATTELFDGSIQESLPFACAIEMIHTYSLIHDDLPSMDNDDYRRGRLTNHKVYGDAIAILAGDALLNTAFEVMLASIDNTVHSEKKMRAMRQIVNSSGIKGMIAGQVVDLQTEGKKIGKKLLNYMNERKTGRMICASATSGAILAGANQENVDNLYKYAHHLGLAFQIKDDILSEIGDFDKLGKSIGIDRRNEKSTYVTALGLERAKRILEEETKSAINILDIYGQKATFLVQLAEYLLHRDK